MLTYCSVTALFNSISLRLFYVLRRSKKKTENVLKNHHIPIDLPDDVS